MCLNLYPRKKKRSNPDIFAYTAHDFQASGNQFELC